MHAIVQHYLKQLGRLPCQKTQHGRRHLPTVKRTRRPVSSIYKELGKHYFRRAYRMGYGTFRKLFRKIAPKLKTVHADKETHNYVPSNGRIHSTVVLACALRLFAGGSAYDLATTYGISVCTGNTYINNCMGVKEYVEKNYPNGVDDFQISIHVTDKPSEDISMGLKRTNSGTHRGRLNKPTVKEVSILFPNDATGNHERQVVFNLKQPATN